MKKIILNLKYSWLVLCVLLAVSCISDAYTERNISSYSENYIHFLLDIPQEETTTTRGVLVEKEGRIIDFATTSILLFKDDVFVQQCYFGASDVKPHSSGQGYVISLKGIEGVGNYDFVFIANYRLEKVAIGASKQQLLNALELKLEGVWGLYNKLIPMWGEAKNISLDAKQGVVNGGKPILVDMLRALARVDIRKSATAKCNIQNVALFRSLDKARIVPDKGAVEPTTGNILVPTVPLKVGHNTSEGYGYLYYVATDINEQGLLTYIPEQEVATGVSDEDLCLVLGVEMEGKSTIRYFRVDFKSAEGVDLAILRNHRYIINIDCISGVGYSTATDAASNPTSGIVTTILDLKDGINDLLVVRDKYFGLENRNFKYDYFEGDERRYKYDTNYSNAELEEMMAAKRWWNNGLFEAELDTDSKELVIKTLGNNFSGHEYESLLSLPLEYYKFDVKVVQQYAELTTDCEYVVVNGTYTEGEELNQTHYIDLMIISDQKLVKGNYLVTVPEVNGISFRGDGALDVTTPYGDKFMQYIRAYGSGMPTNSGDVSLTIESDLGFVCDAEIYVNALNVQPSYNDKLVVGLQIDFNGYAHGYVLEEGTNGNKFLTSEYNFGLQPYSTVQIKPFKNISLSQINEGGYLKHRISGNDQGRDAAKLLSGGYGRIPDVVIVSTAENIQFTSDFANIIKRFADNGGVVIMMLSKGQNPELFLNSYGLNIVQSNRTGGQYSLLELPGDAVFDGPFGSLSGLKWGVSGKVSGVQNVNNRNFIGYVDAPDGVGAGIIRSTDGSSNIVFIGDNGFTVYYNFGVDGYGRPVRIGNSDNAIIFANLFNWALQQAEVNGVKQY